MDPTWNTLEALSTEACLSLLAGQSFGRVGLSVDALPVVLPVNYVVDGHRIVLRSMPGTKVTTALRDAVVCFEIDGVDAIGGMRWSVLVTGMARELLGVDAVLAAALPLRSWSSGEDHFIAITTDVVTGHRVGPAVVSR